MRVAVSGPRRAGLGAVAAVALLVAGSGAAAAHDQLLSTSPADGAVLATAPASIELVFSKPPIALGAAMVVTGPQGDLLGQLQLADATASQSLPPGLPAGDYVVRWRVTSADGHPISGASTFSSAVVRDRRLKLWNTKPMRRLRRPASASLFNPATCSPASL